MLPHKGEAMPWQVMANEGVARVLPHIDRQATMKFCLYQLRILSYKPVIEGRMMDLVSPSIWRFWIYGMDFGAFSVGLDIAAVFAFVRPFKRRNENRIGEANTAKTVKTKISLRNAVAVVVSAESTAFCGPLICLVRLSLRSFLVLRLFLGILRYCPEI
jgi:hypothetical protein